MIEAKAPGKLYIAGEYAVVEAGYPAVLVAVDRYVTVQVEHAQHQGRIFSDQYGRLPVVWTRKDGQVVIEKGDQPVEYMLACLRMVESLAQELGKKPQFYDVTVSSELDDISGRKFGLGSSAAVTVATIHALNEFYGFALSDMELLKLALLATIQVNPMGSGGDIAASMFGGWIAYTTFNRAWVKSHFERDSIRSMLAADWPGLSVRPLPDPAGLQLVVGWTGEPASTTRLVESVQTSKIRTLRDYNTFLGRSRECVEKLIAAFDAHDPERIKQQIRDARAVLTMLSRSTGLMIETPALARLCASAEPSGSAAKSSGAGGGDCGILLADVGVDLEPILREWELSDIRHLELKVHTPSGVLCE